MQGKCSLSPRLQLAERLEVEQCIQVTLPAFLPNVQEERRIPSAIRWERTGVAQPAEIQRFAPWEALAGHENRGSSNHTNT